MTTRRLFLVRHGRSNFDSRDFRETLRGRQWDPDLSPEGREQADRLAIRLALMDPAPSVHCSPFRRCRETIAPYVARSGAEVEVEEDIGEVYIGEWEGLSFEEIVSGDEELARRFREQEAMFAYAPGGESGAALRARVVPAVEGILARSQGDHVVVVAHGGVINAYVGHVLGLDQDMFFLPENTSINTIVADGESRRVHFLNDVRHVTDPELFVLPAGARGAPGGNVERRT